MSYRITKHNKGYLVESSYKSFLGKKKWKPFITYYGLREPFYHSSYEFAEKNLLDYIKWDTLRNSRNEL